MLSRKDRIDEFQLKLTRTEKELYEEFLKTEETALVTMPLRGPLELCWASYAK